MPYYYKIQCSEEANVSIDGIQAYQADFETRSDKQCTKFDFSKYVLIELLDCVTPEEKLWEALGLAIETRIIHKRLTIDAHRVHCRRAIIICVDSEEAKNLAQRLSQTKIFKRCVCAVVLQDLLSDINLFEKRIIHFGDRRSQEQLVYVTDLNRYREPESLVQYLRELFSPFGRILSIFVAKNKNGYAYPEGLVLFSHLSEAFAAELVYDQCIIGMERLSVTVHHNILLSQCDLRTRLKEAQIKSESASFDESEYMLECKYAENKFLFPIRNNANVSAICKTIHHKSNICFNNSSIDTHKNSCPLLHKSLLKNNKLLNLSDLSLPKNFHNCKMLNDQEQSVEIFSHNSGNSDVNLPFEDYDTNCLSQMKKDSSLSQKLCLKRQRLHSIHSTCRTLSSESTLILPTISTFKTQSSAIKCSSEKCKSEDSYRDNSQVLKLRYQADESFNNTILTFDRCIDKENLSDARIRNSPSNSLNNVVPLSADRISEMTFCQQNLAQKGRKSKFKKECPLQFVATIPRCDKNAKSPLKTWLKEELSYSTNNRIADCTENSKKIVCVTPKRDVLVPVGCSHMTCDFCYPRSTNLLFGFY